MLYTRGDGAVQHIAKCLISLVFLVLAHTMLIYRCRSVIQVVAKLGNSERAVKIMRIDTGRILFGVQYKLETTGMQCVATWFTTSEEALEHYKRMAAIATPACKTSAVYTDLRLVTMRLPDGFEDCGTTVVRTAD